ncbi:MAG: GNAT family N-acetyltransferase [Phaeodactylibacter sp.]|nr:GNAT family N-acetyltransferase [Phaeodactylibacter sp.]
MHLHTPRLLLRWLCPDDLEDFLEYRSDPAVLRYQSMSPMSRAQAARFIKSQAHKALGKAGAYQQIGIERQSDGKLVGDCALKLRAGEPRIAEVGYTVNPAFQGQGYATEAVGALVGELFGRLGIHKVAALVDARNPASFRVLEKLGFAREAHLRQSYFDPIDGDWFDEYWYGLLREEWGRGG